MTAYDDKLVKLALKFRRFLDKTPNLTNIYLIATISCMAGMMFGFDISSMSAFLGTTQYQSYFKHPNSSLQGFITSSMSLGSFFGSLASSFISEPFGRRASLMICSLFWMIGAAIQSSSQNVPQLIIGRFISGLGVGFGSSVAPVYGSEMASRKIRGMIGGLFQFSVTLGILIMFYISYGCLHINGIGSFRLAWGLQILPGIFLFTGLFFIPESPRWLAKQNYWEEAETIVANIQAKGDRENPDVMIEISEIKDQMLIEEHVKNFSYKDLFNKKYLPRTLVAVSAQIWQQFTGINVMMYYIVYIFQMAGVSGNANLISSSIQYILNCVMTVPALLLMDKIGRRPLLLGGALFMMIWQFCVAGLLATYSVPWPDSGNSSVNIRIPESNKPAANGVIASCYLFVVSFAVSWGVVVWVYVSEMWGDSVSRQRGAALATSANWIFNFAIAQFTPPAFENIQWRTYIIYASFCAVMFVQVFFMFPETRGKRLEEIDQIWTQKVPAWKSGSWKPDVPILSDAQLGEKITAHHKERSNMHALMSSSSEDKDNGLMQLSNDPHDVTSGEGFVEGHNNTIGDTTRV